MFSHLLHIVSMREGLFEILFLRVMYQYTLDIYPEYNMYLYCVQNLYPIDQVQLINVEFHDV